MVLRKSEWLTVRKGVWKKKKKSHTEKRSVYVKTEGCVREGSVLIGQSPCCGSEEEAILAKDGGPCIPPSSTFGMDSLNQWCSWGQLVPLQGIGLLPLASHFSSIPY